MTATILHLTDLHLRDENLHATKRQKLLHETLRELGRYLRRKERTLDAVVINGDITDRGTESGFKLLKPLLEELGESLPAPNRIVVVPGNHDLQRSPDVNSPERYELFENYVSSQGYIIPALRPDDEVNPERNLLIDDDAGFILVPFNSSHWCALMDSHNGFTEDQHYAAFVESSPGPEVRELFQSLRLRDRPRIPDEHLSPVRDALGELDPDNRLVRVAILHHHLLPVSTIEDGPREQHIANLGLLRTILRENKISVVLHGHKHTARAYYEYLADAEASSAAYAPVMLVVSASTLGEGRDDRLDVCRLVGLAGRPHARSAVIARVDAVEPGRHLERLDDHTYPLWPAPTRETMLSPQPVMITGDTVDKVYPRLMELCHDTTEESPALNLTCHIGKGEAPQLPGEYPTHRFAPGEDPQKWLEETVGWWQRPDRTREYDGLQFSHGDRIERYGGKQDQFEEAVKLLSNQGTYRGRCVISLLDPRIDRIGETEREHKFPAFITAQFIKRPLQDGAHPIDCVGYFRKQELRYWWPVNVAELRTLQARLVEKIGTRDHMVGTLTMITAIGYAGKVEPRVAVPRIDRLHASVSSPTDAATADITAILRLALDLVPSQNRDPSTARKRWQDDVLADLLGPEETPTIDVPIALEGLRGLSDEIRKVSMIFAEEKLKEVAELLSQLYEHNERYARELVDARPNEGGYQRWRNSAQAICKRIEQAVEKCLA